MTLTPEVRVGIELIRRYSQLMHMINLSRVECLVIWTMILEPGPWQVKTLANHIECARGTVRDRIEDNVRAGHMEYLPDRSVQLTTHGREIYERGVAECVHVCAGLGSFSTELLAEARNDFDTSSRLRQALRVDHDLGALSFPPLISTAVLPLVIRTIKGAFRNG